jgi:starch-binding outer membrane protein, SusD/RagB family
MRINTIFIIVAGTFFLSSCKKLINISPPVGTVVASQLFSNDGEATSAASGMYFKMINTTQSFSNFGLSVFSGMSADELIPFDQNYNDLYVQFQQNELVPSNGLIANNFWANAYSVIYQANAIIQGLATNPGVHDSVKNELIGEAEFVRAFCNFYLVNLFGPIPLVTTIKYQETSLLARSPTSQVYQAIVADLKDAQSKLATDYSVGGSQRIVPNKWAAVALLSRVYLYTNDWQDAVNEADSIINNSSLYGLVQDPNSVFLVNSNEAIWQLQQSNTTGPWYNSTPEGFTLIPRALNSNAFHPFAYFTTTLLNSFEPNDLREIDWIDSTQYNGVTYYFPFKYKMGSGFVGAGPATPGGTYSEYYMVLRLSEQYLIRAEAKAELEDGTAIVDLNAIRTRAGLSNYMGSMDKDSVLNVIYHERQVELFAEWGHRWLDLKRSGQAIPVLSTNKGFSLDKSTLLYPIPTGELIADPNLVQNSGY